MKQYKKKKPLIILHLTSLFKIYIEYEKYMIFSFIVRRINNFKSTLYYFYFDWKALNNFYKLDLILFP